MNDPLSRLTNRPIGTEELTLALDPNDAQRLLDARSKERQAQSAMERAEGAVERAGTSATEAQRAAAERAAAEHAAASEALAAFEASIVTFTVHVTAIGMPRLEELKSEHPATKAQKAAARAAAGGDPKAEPQWNQDTFAPALLSEAVTRIEFSDGDVITSLSPSQAAAIWNGKWPEGDRVTVFNIAVLINEQSSSVGNLGKG